MPARATRLLNRRLQNTSNSPLSQSDSPRSLDSINSRNTCKSSLKEHLKQKQQQNLQSQLINSSSEDLLLDKSLRNSMLQDVVTFKKQLVHLRRILQEVNIKFKLISLFIFICNLFNNYLIHEFMIIILISYFLTQINLLFFLFFFSYFYNYSRNYVFFNVLGS